MTKKDLILLTKLQPPKIKGKVLRRERLINNLEENLHKKLILICAGAGYGKTTLLAQFCEEFNQPYVYYDIDAEDNDLATFLDYLISGIRKYSADFGRRIKSIIPQVRDTEIVIGTFINEFTERVKKNFYIVLDDYHHLQKNIEVAKNLDYLLRYMPDNLHIIIASRSTPPLNLSYYSSKQELFQIEKEHLQFTIKELESLLKNIYGLTLPKTEITRIAEHSEGWVTAIQLILQKIYAVGEKTTEETINSYLASGEELFHYFAREVFEHQPKKIREFLIRTSILDSLVPETCNYLLNIRATHKILSYLEIEHIFVSRVGNKFKYHPIFREFLNKRLADYYPGETIKKLHRKMGNYFLSTHDYPSAVNHFLLAENYSRAASVLSKQYGYWRNSGQFANFIRFIERFPKAVIEKLPHLLLKEIRPLLYLGETGTVLKLLKSISQTFRRTRDHRGMNETLYLTGYVYLTLMELGRAIRFMKQAHRLIDQKNSVQKVEILLGFASIYRILGKYKNTEKYLKEALKMAKRLRNVALEIRVIRSLAYLYWAASNYKRADEVYTNIFSRFKDKFTEFELGKMYGNAAIIALNNNNIKRALEYLAQAERIAYQYNDQRTITFLLALRGEYYMYQGEYEKAIELFEKTLELNKKFNEKIIDHYTLIDMCDVYLKMGKISAAHATLKKLQPLLSEKISPHPLVEYLLLRGKIENENGNFIAGIDSFNKALKLSRKVAQPEQEMLVHYEMSGHFLKVGRLKEALEHFKKCLIIVQRHNYSAVLITEGRYNLKLIEFGLENGLFPDYLMYILKEIGNEEAKILFNKMNIKRGTYDLECNFFGNMEVRNKRNRIINPKWRTKKTKSLFSFLVINQQQKFSRNYLTDLLWPKKGMREAAHSLQVEISYIRNMLKRLAKSELTAKDVILYRNQKYFLTPHLLIKTDVHDFEELLKDAIAYELADKHKSIQLYQNALILYRGDFCSDIIDEWCETKRSYYKEKVTEIYKKLGKFYYDKKQFRKAIELYQKDLEFNQYDESIHLGLMRCYAAIKDRDGVKRQYQILIKSLKKLGVSSPSPETQAVYRESLK